MGETRVGCDRVLTANAGLHYLRLAVIFWILYFRHTSRFLLSQRELLSEILWRSITAACESWWVVDICGRVTTNVVILPEGFICKNSVTVNLGLRFLVFRFAYSILF